jgi:hypothetical protein
MTMKKYSILLIALLITLLPQLTGSAAPDNLPRLDPDDDIKVYLPIISRAQPVTRIVIDHTSLELFDRIPENYIQAASQFSMLFRHASVGYNIDYGLNCLADNLDPRPPGCDGSVPPEQIIYNEIYNRDNWFFEFHQPPPSQNPGWWEKFYLFEDRVDSLTPSEQYDVVAYKHGYVDAYSGSLIDDLFFVHDPNDPYPSIFDYEALAARHRDKTFVLWTMGLARLSYPDSQNFNQQMRAYAVANNKILMDIAAIESHRPNGQRCYSILNNGVEAICDEYTDEDGGGHLNGLGAQRMAKAVWVLMARLAGWNP